MTNRSGPDDQRKSGGWLLLVGLIMAMAALLLLVGWGLLTDVGGQP